MKKFKAFKLLSSIFINYDIDYESILYHLNTNGFCSIVLEDKTIVDIKQQNNSLISRVITNNMDTIDAVISLKKDVKSWIPGVADKKVITSTVNFCYRPYESSSYDYITGRFVLDDEKIFYQSYKEKRNVIISENNDFFAHLECIKDRTTIAIMNFNDSDVLFEYIGNNKSLQVTHNPNETQIEINENNNNQTVTLLNNRHILYGTRIDNKGRKYDKILDSEGVKTLYYILKNYNYNYYEELDSIKDLIGSDIFDRLANCTCCHLNNQTYKVLFKTRKNNDLSYKLLKQ